MVFEVLSYEKGGKKYFCWVHGIWCTVFH